MDSQSKQNGCATTKWICYFKIDTSLTPYCDHGNGYGQGWDYYLRHLRSSLNPDPDRSLGQAWRVTVTHMSQDVPGNHYHNHGDGNGLDHL